MSLIPESLISSFGNVVATLAELVGTVSGDKKLLIKPNSVQNALHVNSNNNSCITIPETLPPDQEAVVETSRKDIYANPDIHLTVPELIKKYGYPFESHEVVTKDDYILTVFRIPRGRSDGNLVESKRTPVLMVHGLLNSAGAWVIHEPEKALGYMLADRGFDVWMLNCRGCTYSKSHRRLTPSDKEYWNFSFHEMGTMDIPAVIDYILAYTGQESLHYIGHSLGNTKLMIAMNEDEEIVKKIRLFVCFAPAVYLYKTTARILRLNAPFYRQQKKVLEYFSEGGEFMSRTFLQQIKSLYVVPKAEYLASKCVTTSMYTMGGHNPDQINWDILPVVAGHTPSSSSIRTYIHCLQYFVNSDFKQYDYGSEAENLEAYGQTHPPKYDLSRVTCPTVIYYGENDLLCRPETVVQLASELPNVRGCHRVDCDKFSHTDFLYAKDIDSLLYNQVVALLLNEDNNLK